MIMNTRSTFYMYLSRYFSALLLSHELITSEIMMNIYKKRNGGTFLVFGLTENCILKTNECDPCKQCGLYKALFKDIISAVVTNPLSSQK